MDLKLFHLNDNSPVNQLKYIRIKKLNVLTRKLCDTHTGYSTFNKNNLFLIIKILPRYKYDICNLHHKIQSITKTKISIFINLLHHQYTSTLKNKKITKKPTATTKHKTQNTKNKTDKIKEK